MSYAFLFLMCRGAGRSAKHEPATRMGGQRLADWSETQPPKKIVACVYHNCIVGVLQEDNAVLGAHYKSHVAARAL